MKEQLFSGIDTHDDTPSLMWVSNGRMAISTDHGDDTPWRTEHPDATGNLFAHPNFPHDPSRFTDPTLVWERDI